MNLVKGPCQIFFNGVEIGNGDVTFDLPPENDPEPDRFDVRGCALNDWIYRSALTAPDDWREVVVPLYGKKIWSTANEPFSFEPVPRHVFVRARVTLTDRTILLAWKRVR